MAGLFNRNFSPARPVSPLMRNTPDILSESQYLQELLTERQKLAPFMPVLPICTHLLNQELRRVSGLLPNHFGEFEDLHRRSPSPNPMASPCHISNNGMIGWNGNMNPEFLGLPHGMIMDLDAAELSPHSFPVKKIVRLDIPIDAYPTFNFVGRLLGPRGNSLKRVEAQTGCRVYIRGQGSIKDPEKEEKLRGKPGYEHLKDPLHILIEAELPKNIVDMKMRQAQEIIEELLKPVDESQDAYKRQQLRELALLNSSEKEDGLQRSTSASSFSNNGTVQANGGQNDKFTITAIDH